MTFKILLLRSKYFKVSTKVKSELLCCKSKVVTIVVIILIIAIVVIFTIVAIVAIVAIVQ